MLASCASDPTIQTIPEAWKLPASVEGEKCPDISGCYMNSGEDTDGKSAISLDHQWFFGYGEYDKYFIPPYPYLLVSQTLLRQEEMNQLEIVGMSDSGTTKLKRLLKKESGDFSCQDGWLRVAGSYQSGGGGLIQWNNVIKSFAKADGYLIEKVEYNYSGFAVIIPFSGYGTRWYRFSPVEGRGDEAPQFTKCAPDREGANPAVHTDAVR